VALTVDRGTRGQNASARRTNIKSLEILIISRSPSCNCAFIDGEAVACAEDGIANFDRGICTNGTAPSR
jgi:hypothetical protein